MSEKYFLGAVSGGRFRTEFEDLIRDSGRFTYILKGGAGTGKSTMMKKIAEHFEKTHRVIRFCCSSDPASLDAVVIPELGAAVCDGTAPHVFEPIYPGICQKYLDLGQFWDSAGLLGSKDEIIAAADKNRSLLTRAQRFTSAASDICSDTCQLGCDCLLGEKTEAFVKRFEKHLLGKHGSGTGEKRLLRLTALTEHGFLTMSETLAVCAERYILHDDLFAASDYLLSRLADEAVSRGYDVILSPEQMLADAGYQHLIIPELSAALISGSYADRTLEEGAKRINLMRFYDKKALSDRRMRLRMNKAAADDLIREAAVTIRTAKSVHDDLESYYIAAMDFSKLDELTAKVISEIENRA